MLITGMAEKIDVAKIVIENKEGKILILKKSSEYDWKADKWELPGGKIEKDEDRFGAAERETKAETGLKIENPEDLVRMEVEAEKTVNCYCLFTDEFSGEVQLSDEHQDHLWISKSNVREVEWHRDAAYIIPVIEHLEEYLEKDKSY